MQESWVTEVSIHVLKEDLRIQEKYVADSECLPEGSKPAVHETGNETSLSLETSECWKYQECGTCAKESYNFRAKAIPREGLLGIQTLRSYSWGYPTSLKSVLLICAPDARHGSTRINAFLAGMKS